MHQEQVAEVFSAALPALLQAVEVAGDPSAAEMDRLAAASGFSERLEGLWPSLEASGSHVVGFLAFLDMTVSALPQRVADGDAESVVLVFELIALLEAHLAAPDDPDVVDALIELATSDTVDPPLDPEEVTLWLNRGWLAAAEDPLPTEAGAPAEDAAEAPRQVVPATFGQEVLPELGAEAADMLGVLDAAVEESSAEILGLIGELGAADASVRDTAAQALAEILGRFAEASADVGFAAFATLCTGIGERMLAVSADRTWPEPLLAGLARLPRRLLGYLRDPLSESSRLELVETLRDPYWPDPLSATSVVALVSGLYQDLLVLQPDAGPPRPVALAPEDLSLRPADDIDIAVLASFRREGAGLTQHLTAVVQDIVAGDTGALRHAQRLAHTLKGSANVCGVRAVATLSHHLEDLLEFLVEQDLAPSPALGDALVAGGDALAMMFDVINGLESHAADDFGPVMQLILDWANRLDREGRDALADQPCAPLPTPAVTPLPLAADSVPVESQTAPEDVYLQVPARTVEDLLRFMGELAVALGQSEAQLEQARRILRESGALGHRNLLQVAELEKLVDLRGAKGAGRLGSTADPGRSVDRLELDQYDEMYIVTRQLNEGMNDTREFARVLDGVMLGLADLTEQQIKLGRQMRQLTMATRLVPVHTVVARLQRTVRQTCRATGKEAELLVQDGEVRMDSEVLDRLLPAMMHLVRNSIDHGIEPADQRELAGKPRHGQLRIGFRQSGDQIEVSFDDDGRGLDLEAVKAKGIVLGLLDPDVAVTAQELAQLTLRPGFSTRQQATQVSGRGVGMDVVATTLRSLNGSLSIDAEAESGYRFRARLPASQLTIHCLSIQCRDQLFAFPANEVRMPLLSDEGEVVETADGWRFIYGGHAYPLVHLDALLGLDDSRLDQGRRVVLLLDPALGDQAVMVDDLLDGRELVVMKPGPLVPRIPGLMAASILGDGRVIPIIELRALLQLAAAGLPTLVAADAVEQVGLPTVLIVDDSLSMRRTLAQLIADSGYRPLTARDGVDAIQVMTRDAVDLLLIDMEMPRMNGLELAVHLRSQPASRHLPIAMITSRSTERYRREALQAGVDRYFVKPYRDEEILDFLQQALDFDLEPEPGDSAGRPAVMIDAPV